MLFLRHADTRGEPCDRSFRVGDRPGQRNISEAGRAQARRIGERLRELGVPLALPVLAGPVYRARDTAEEAFGAGNVAVTNGLLADDFAGGRLGWVLDQHRQFFSAPVPAGANRVLVGHRTPAIMVAGEAVGGRAFPEGTALVVAPGGGDGFRILGILALAPLVGGRLPRLLRCARTRGGRPAAAGLIGRGVVGHQPGAAAMARRRTGLLLCATSQERILDLVEAGGPKEASSEPRFMTM